MAEILVKILTTIILLVNKIMASFSNLISNIKNSIKNNGNNEITGDILQEALVNIIQSIAAGRLFVGIATQSTRPGSYDQNVFYIAIVPGVYPLFGGKTLENGNIGFFYNVDNEWELTQVPLKVGTESIIDGSITQSKFSVNALAAKADIHSIISIKPKVLRLGSSRAENTGKYLNVYHPVFKITNDSELSSVYELKNVKICLMVYQKRVGKKLSDNTRRQSKHGWCLSYHKDCDIYSESQIVLSNPKTWDSVDGAGGEQIIQIKEEEIKKWILNEYISITSYTRKQMQQLQYKDMFGFKALDTWFGSNTSQLKNIKSRLFGIAIRCDNPAFQEAGGFPYRAERIDKYIYSDVFKIRASITDGKYDDLTSGACIGLSYIG